MWYGRKAYSKSTPWRKQPARLLTLPALNGVLQGLRKEDLDDMEVIVYEMKETGSYPAAEHARSKDAQHRGQEA